MAENPHYKELLQLLNEFEVEYLIGFAVMQYSDLKDRRQKQKNKLFRSATRLICWRDQNNGNP